MSQNQEWRKKLLQYVIDKEFRSVKDIPYNKVIRDICPGQTALSLANFLGNLSSAVSAGDMPFYEYCRKHLNNPPPWSYLGNENKRIQRQSEYALKILEIKQNMK